MRRRASQVIGTIDRAMFKSAVIQLTIGFPILVVGRIMNRAQFPFRIGSVLADTVKNRYKMIIIGRIHLDQIDQRHIHLQAIRIQSILRAFVGCVIGAVSQIIIDLITVYQRCSGIRHMIGGVVVLQLKRFRKTTVTDHRYQNTEQQQQQYGKGDDIRFKVFKQFFEDFHNRSFISKSQCIQMIDRAIDTITALL